MASTLPARTPPVGDDADRRPNAPTCGAASAPTVHVAHGAGGVSAHLHHCDAQTLLADSVAVADESVSLILTDPPYLISKETGFAQGGDKRFAISMDFGAWDREGGFSLKELDAIVGAFGRVLRPGGAAVVFFDVWKISALAAMLNAHGFVSIALVEWVKTNPPPINARRAIMSNAREVALAALKPDRTGMRGSVFNGANFTGTFHYPIAAGRERKHNHPTQKSGALFEELIAIHTDPGDLVLDCFAGSATTTVSAMRTGRRSISCEPHADFYAKAVDRLDSTASAIVSGDAAHA